MTEVLSTCYCCVFPCAEAERGPPALPHHGRRSAQSGKSLYPDGLSWPAPDSSAEVVSTLEWQWALQHFPVLMASCILIHSCGTMKHNISETSLKTFTRNLSSALPWGIIHRFTHCGWISNSYPTLIPNDIYENSPIHCHNLRVYCTHCSCIVKRCENLATCPNSFATDCWLQSG